MPSFRSYNDNSEVTLRNETSSISAISIPNADGTFEGTTKQF